MKSITHPAAVGFGLANLYLITLTGPIISTEHDLVYHLIGSATSIIVPVMCYVLVLWGLLFGLLVLAQRRRVLRAAIWSGVLLAVPPLLLHAWISFTEARAPLWVSRFVVVMCVALFVAACVLWNRTLRVLDRVQPVAATVFGFLAITGVFVFAQLVWSVVAARNLNPSPALHHNSAAENVAGSASARHRVIWLLLDELSYQQVYEQRFPGLELPAFDRLAAQSTVFTHVVPTGEHTSYILPTLLTGIAADAADISASGMLVGLRDPATGRWVGFDQHNTVFQDALNAGYTTAVAGWYIPYCRILPAELDHCFWTYREDTPANLSPNRAVADGLVRPVRQLRRGLEHLFFGKGRGTPTAEMRDLREHTRDYSALTAAADRFVNDGSIDFLMLHLPVPHPYGFYDRRTHEFAAHHTSYIDNLALADVYLTHLRQMLEQRGEWDSTTLVVMGDHSWRTRILWVDSASWTAEDEAASHGGQFDDRPAMIVKLPGQQTPARIDQMWSAVRTRALLDALLERRLQEPVDLAEWAGGRGQAQPQPGD